MVVVLLEAEPTTTHVSSYCKFGAKRLAYFPPGTIAWGQGAGWDDIRKTKGKSPLRQTHAWRLHGDGIPRAAASSDATSLQRHEGLLNQRGVHMLAFGADSMRWSATDDGVRVAVIALGREDGS